MEYGCDVVNKFAFTVDEEADDPQELIKRAAAERSAKIAAEKKKEEQARIEAEAKAKAEATAKLDAIKNAITGRGGARGGGRGRGGPRPPRAEGERGNFRGGRGRGGPRTPFQGRPVEGGEGEQAVDENAPEGENRRPRGGFVGGRGRGRGAPRGDRQSGTGLVKSHEKKDGHGKGNWGTDKDELAGETEEVKVEEEEQEPIPPREKTAEELRLEAIEAEIAKQKTYAEYKASLQKESSFKIRKAGEGAEENFGVLRRVQKEEVVRNIPQKKVEEVSENPNKILIDFKFTSANRDNNREERGGRGGFRGRGGRGGRGGNQQRPAKASTAINPNDTNAFPALG